MQPGKRHGFAVARIGQDFVFHDARGRVLLADPRVTEGHGRGETHDAWRVVTAANDELAIDAATGRCAWDGRPPQYELIVNDLWRLEQRADA